MKLAWMSSLEREREKEDIGGRERVAGCRRREKGRIDRIREEEKDG
jgi:hypothetical protein